MQSQAAESLDGSKEPRKRAFLLAQHQTHGRFVSQRVVANHAVLVIWVLQRSNEGGVNRAVGGEVEGRDGSLVLFCFFCRDA